MPASTFPSVGVLATWANSIPARRPRIDSVVAVSMIAPLATMASLFAAPLRNLGYALSQLVAQKEAAAPAAEAPAPVAATPPAVAEAPAEAPAEVPAAKLGEAASLLLDAGLLVVAATKGLDSEDVKILENLVKPHIVLQLEAPADAEEATGAAAGIVEEAIAKLRGLGAF